MLRRTLLPLILFMATFQLHAQEGAVVTKYFLILASTTDYEEALAVAKEAAPKLNLKIDLKGYYPSEEEGLTTDETCGCGLNHGYIPRGRSDDGDYISIEYSGSFENFADGYYIVVASSGERKEVLKTRDQAKEFYPQAYAKSSKVYVGCMH